MKKVLILLSFALLIMASCGKHNSSSKGKINLGNDVKLSNDLDTVTYCIGIYEARREYMQLKGNLSRFDEFKTIKYQLITKAFEKIMSGDSIEASNEMIGMTINNFLKKKHDIIYAKNLKEGKEFLEKNKKNSDVHVLPSGLQYQVIKEGTGPKPDSSSMVSVNYVGTTISGEQFDATTGKQPFQTPVVGQTIKGWTEALLKMNVGSKWKIFVPAELGYGEQTTGKIKAGMTLIFEMELLSIDAKPAAQPNMGQPNMGGPNMGGPNPRMKMQMKR